jgi:hypothetical protein
MAIPALLDATRSLTEVRQRRNTTKVITRTVPLAVLGAALIAALALLGLRQADGGTAIARAQVPVIVAIDMDPTGNSCPGDGVNDCTLGPIDSCVQPAGESGAACANAVDDDGDGMINDGCPAVGPAESGTQCANAADDDTDGSVNDGCPVASQFDVIVDDLPLGGIGFGQAAIDFQLLWGAQVTPPEPDVIDITARSPVSTLIHYLQQAPGSSSMLNDAQALPRLLPPYVGSINDLGTEETNPPWTQGTGWRGALTVAAGAANGFYKLEFDAPYMWVGNSVPNNECETETPPGPGCTLQNAVVAVGVPCPAHTPVSAGGVAELPDVSGSSGPPYAALAGGLAVAVLALTARAWYARRRRAR